MPRSQTRYSAGVRYPVGGLAMAPFLLVRLPARTPRLAGKCLEDERERADYLRITLNYHEECAQLVGQLLAPELVGCGGHTLHAFADGAQGLEHKLDLVLGEKCRGCLLLVEEGRFIDDRLPAARRLVAAEEACRRPEDTQRRVGVE